MSAHTYFPCCTKSPDPRELRSPSSRIGVTMKPVWINVHHHPVRGSIPHRKSIAQSEPRRLCRRPARHPGWQLRAVAGHQGRTCEAEDAQAPAADLRYGNHRALPAPGKQRRRGADRIENTICHHAHGRWASMRPTASSISGKHGTWRTPLSAEPALGCLFPPAGADPFHERRLSYS